MTMSLFSISMKVIILYQEQCEFLARNNDSNNYVRSKTIIFDIVSHLSRLVYSWTWYMHFGGCFYGLLLFIGPLCSRGYNFYLVPHSNRLKIVKQSTFLQYVTPFEWRI